MLRTLYNRTIALAARKSAPYWLAAIAFVESSDFLRLADVMFIPMVIARPRRAWAYAIVATFASVLGGVLGWAIGYYAFTAVAEPVLIFYGKLDVFHTLAQSVDYRAILLLRVAHDFSFWPGCSIDTVKASGPS